MKLLLALIILLIIASVFFYRRACPYLLIARQIYRLLRQAQQQAGIAQTLNARETVSVDNRSSRFRVSPNEAGRPQTADKLARCASCGAWTPLARAVKIQNTTFCSHACLERAAEKRK